MHNFLFKMLNSLLIMPIGIFFSAIFLVFYRRIFPRSAFRKKSPIVHFRYLQSRHFSRQCLICLCPNPYRRAVMVKCGHITCTSCAERLGTEENIEFACPFCRTPTTYMKMFEESDTQLARLRAEKQTRKRKRGAVAGQ